MAHARSHHQKDSLRMIILGIAVALFIVLLFLVGKQVASQSKVSVIPRQTAPRGIAPEPFGRKGIAPEPFGRRGVAPEPFGRRGIAPDPFGRRGVAPLPW